MNIILPKSKILVAFLFFVFMQATAFGATITSTGTGGNWNSVSSWVGGVVPTSNDDVIIASGSTVTITADAFAKSISVSGTLMVNDGVVFTVGSLTTSGNFTVNSGGSFTTANGSGLSTIIVYGNYINNGTTDFWKSTVIIVGDLLSPSTSGLQKQGNVVVGGNIIGDFNLTGGNGTGQIYAVNPNATVTITPVSIDNNVPPGTTVNIPPETQVLVDLVNSVLYGICSYTVSGTVNAIVCTSNPTASFTVAASGSSPTYQWQVNSGSGWSNLTNVAPYAGVTSNTLTITISGTGLSGNKYRANITSGGCTKNGDYGTLTVTTVAPSTPVAITGDAIQCPSNSGQIYTATAVSGATSYIWTVPAGWTINSGNGTTSIFVTTGLVGNNGNITVTASNGCGTSSSRNLAVTVISSPTTAGTIAGSTSYCSFTNSTILTLSGTSLPIGNGNGKASVIRWESSVDDFVTSTVIANTTTALTVTDLSLTTKFRAIVQANSGGCPEDSFSATITINVTPTSVISGTATTCNGTSKTISIDLTGTGPWGLTYTDGTTPVSVTNIASSPYTFNVTPSSTKTYTVTALNDSKCTALATDRTGSAIITVNTLSAAPTGITGTSTICNGSSTILTVSGGTAGTGATAEWFTGSCGGTSAGTGNSITVSPTSNTTYYVRYAGTCNTTTCASQLVTVNTLSAAPTGITGTSTICNGSSTTLTVSGGTAGTGATAEWFTGSCGGISAGTGNSITVSPTSNTTYYVRYAGTCNITACASQLVTVNTLSAAPTGITGTSTICNGSSTTLTVSGGTAGTGATAEWFTGSCGGTSAGTGNSVTVSPTSNTTYYVRYAGTCNTTACVSQLVTVSSTAISGQPSGSVVCLGDNAAFSVTASGLGVTYQWQLSTNGGTVFNAIANSAPYSNVTTATMNITAATLAMNTYQYRCVVSGTCVSSVISNAVLLTVNSDSGSISLNGGSPIATNTTVFYCPATTAVFSIAAVSGATGYTWAVPAGWNIISGAGTNTITVTTGTSAQSGTIFVTANTMFCPSYIMVTLSSTAPSAIAISKIDPTCIIPTGTVTAVPPSVVGTLSYTLIKTSTSPEQVISQNATGQFTGLAGGDYVVMYQIDSGCFSARSLPVSIIPLVTNTWKGSVLGWSKGSAPTINDFVVFDADYSEPDSVNSCSCVINSGANVTIGLGILGSGAVLNVINGLDINGGLIFENNASLVQLKNDAINHGMITYKRTTPGLKDFDYEYWSSPVESQKLSDLYVSDRYFRFINGAWEAQGGNVIMDIGRGYIIRVRTNSPPFYQNVSFIGKPNNGIKLIASQGANKSNLIGNPYPSAIDAEDFILDNQPLSGGTLYFWTHYTARTLSSTGTEYKYNADDYALFNLTGGGATAPSTNNTGATPLGEIASGQSFFVISDAIGDFKFTNSMRFDVKNKNSQFFKYGSTKKTANIKRNRVWLNLTNDSGAFKQLLVGYITGATNDFDKLYDGVTRNGNAYIDFYSVNNSVNYTIQGRALPFDEADVVPLGYKTTIEGTFQINIDKVDGSLVNQPIYLEDKLTHTIHDLKSGAYFFTTAVGVFKDRFVLRYTDIKVGTLGTGDVAVKEKGVFVSVKNREIKINSFDQILNAVKIYDLKGSLIYEKNKVDRNEFIVTTLTASNQFMIVMVQLESGEWISEEIIFHD